MYRVELAMREEDGHPRWFLMPGCDFINSCYGNHKSMQEQGISIQRSSSYLRKSKHNVCLNRPPSD